ncbi:hypothetical protein F4778DRAFT_182490 [Xylariomycetidae sp. FL2044]|nr:hypothetical protein F4778DRAFT_182490 [Xylariomycetidae sp. FL2044]
MMKSSAILAVISLHAAAVYGTPTPVSNQEREEVCYHANPEFVYKGTFPRSPPTPTDGYLTPAEPDSTSGDYDTASPYSHPTPADSNSTPTYFYPTPADTYSTPYPTSATSSGPLGDRCVYCGSWNGKDAILDANTHDPLVVCYPAFEQQIPGRCDTEDGLVSCVYDW